MTDSPESSRKAKQVIVIRRDLGMRRGKEIAQGAHASMRWLCHRLSDSSEWPASLSSEQREFHGFFSPAEAAWLKGSFRKITCQVPGEAELNELMLKAAELNVIACLVTDSGLTEFSGVPTVTAVAVGPDWDDKVDLITKDLKLY